MKDKLLSRILLGYFFVFVFTKTFQEKCSISSEPENYCFKPSEEEPQESNYYLCNRNKNEYCCNYIEVNKQIKCSTLKNFVGESCSKNLDCSSSFCKDGKCAYKKDNETCISDKECDLTSFCNDNIRLCQKYLLNEDDECGEEKGYCSPEFVCVENRCKKLGKIKNGENSSHAFLCESFKVVDYDNSTCTGEYDLSKPKDFFNFKKSQIYKTIDWKDPNIKLSDYAGKNMGDVELFEKMVENDIDNLVNKSENINISCINQIYKEIKILANDYDDPYSLTDKDIKSFFQIPDEPNNVKNNNLKFFIIIAIIAAIIILIVIIVFVVKTLKKKKRNIKVSLPEKENDVA